MFRASFPMKPTMVAKLPSDRSKWLLEPKLDGYRVIAVRTAGRSNLYSMDGKSYNLDFPDIYEALSRILVKELVLDGEIVAVEPTGRPNFNALQNRKSTNQEDKFFIGGYIPGSRGVGELLIGEYRDGKFFTTSND